eukprot:jgi/Hompol1/4404/HPOL_003633-RA
MPITCARNELRALSLDEDLELVPGSTLEALDPLDAEDPITSAENEIKLLIPDTPAENIDDMYESSTADPDAKPALESVFDPAEVPALRQNAAMRSSP